MAHFAKVNNENYTVENVIKVDNTNLLDENGNESEAVGQAYIASIGLSGTWIQTSYNRNFRGEYAGIGMVYDPIENVFKRD